MLNAAWARRAGMLSYLPRSARVVAPTGGGGGVSLCAGLGESASCGLLLQVVADPMAGGGGGGGGPPLLEPNRIGIHICILKDELDRAWQLQMVTAHISVHSSVHSASHAVRLSLPGQRGFPMCQLSLYMHVYGARRACTRYNGVWTMRGMRDTGVEASLRALSCALGRGQVAQVAQVYAPRLCEDAVRER